MFPLPSYSASAGSVRTANEALGRLLACDPSLLQGAGLAQRVFELDRDRFAACLTAGDGQRAVEYRVEIGGGELLPVRDVAIQDGGAWVAVVLDRSAELLAAARAEDLLAQESRGELAAAVAHEVNNPLSGVLNYVQLAERLAADVAPLREPLAAIGSEARRIQELTRALLVHAPRSTQEPYALPLEGLIRGALAPMRRRLREELVHVDVSLAAELPPVRGVGLCLQSALRQLLENAREALEDRYPGRDPRKRLSLRAKPVGSDPATAEAVLVEVSDTGAGLPPRAGTPFFSTRAGRRGLGLTLAREAVTAVGGTLELAASSEGTTAALSLPAWS